MKAHYQVGGALQPCPWNDANAPWIREGEDQQLQEVYDANAPLILEPHNLGPLRSVYNFYITLFQLMGFADNIYNREQRAFRLNIVFGVILQHRETGQYRYFVPYNNNGIFERPFYLSKRADLNRLRLRRVEIVEELLRHRPNTKWLPVLMTNVHYIVFNTNYPIGQGQLPDYLLKKDFLYLLLKNRQTRKWYTDNLCAFRCLALHRGHDIKSIEGPAQDFYKQWSDQPAKEFEGLNFEDFPAFEILFFVNLEVYNLTEDGFAHSVYKSRGQHGSTMYVNLYQNHLSYIRDFAIYAKKYQCKTCEHHFDRSFNLHRHQRSCDKKTNFVYPGGFYQSTESIFEKLEQYNIHVPEKERFFPRFICYDLEALLEPVDDRPTVMLQWTQRHVPVSVSICSNVQGYTEPTCIVEEFQDRLVETMVGQMKKLASRVFELAEDKCG